MTHARRKRRRTVRLAAPALLALALLALPAEGAGGTLPQETGQVDLLDEANLRIDGALANDQLESVAGAGDATATGAQT